MANERVRDRGAQVLLTTASLVLVVAGLKAIKMIALPILLAVVLSILSAPLMKWLCDNRIPKVIAVLTTVLANVTVMAAFLLLVGGSINAFAQSIPKYQDRLEEIADTWLDWLDDQGIDTSELSWLRQEDLLPQELILAGQSGAADDSAAPETKAPPNAPNGTEPPDDQIKVTSILDLVVSLMGTLLRSIGSVLGMTFIVFVLMIFILFEASGLPRKLQAAFGWRNETMVRFTSEIQRYLLIKTVVSLATGALVGIGLWLSRVEYPLLWGLLTFLLNYIPNVGSIIASLLPVLLSWVDKGLGQAILVAFIFLGANVALGNFVEPHLMGRQFGISTLVVVLSLIFWFWLWGPVGMLLSVPLTLIVKIMLENTEDFRWVARLIGTNPRVTLGSGKLDGGAAKPA